MNPSDLTTKEAAQELGVTYSQMMRLIYRGKVRTTRRAWVYYVSRDEVERLRGVAA